MEPAAPHHRGWFDVGLSAAELRPQHFLSAGQSFSWKSCGDGEWLGVIDDSLVHIKQTSFSTLCRCVASVSSSDSSAATSASTDSPTARCTSSSSPPNCSTAEQLSCLWCLDSSGRCICNGLVSTVRQLFNADVPIVPLIEEWICRDAAMRVAVEQLKGFRVMKIAPIECVFAFICSANNNIPRITLLVDRLRRECGDLICDCSDPLPLITHKATSRLVEELSLIDGIVSLLSIKSVTG
eukprot:GHVS01081978.1.p1 GENE.GHVS01081978.1~~GHVS01081978.1.p1  ORF type:complete len:239 (-),score=38.76 GHVS01081978.1:671-1387(-)